MKDKLKKCADCGEYVNKYYWSELKGWEYIKPYIKYYICQKCILKDVIELKIDYIKQINELEGNIKRFNE